MQVSLSEVRHIGSVKVGQPPTVTGQRGVLGEVFAARVSEIGALSSSSGSGSASSAVSTWLPARSTRRAGT